MLVLPSRSPTTFSSAAKWDHRGHQAAGRVVKGPFEPGSKEMRLRMLGIDRHLASIGELGSVGLAGVASVAVSSLMQPHPLGGHSFVMFVCEVVSGNWHHATIR